MVRERKCGERLSSRGNRGEKVLEDVLFFFFSSRRRHTRSLCDWSSDVCSSDLWFSVKELKVPMVNYLEMGGSNGFLFRN